jgi:transcriptional repressor NrdR
VQCPHCKATDSRVIDSRAASNGQVIWRRRECDGCKHRFTTYERVEYSLPTVLKRDGRRETFDREKLARSLRIACKKRPISDDDLEIQVARLEQALGEEGLREISSRDLGERVMQLLRSLDDVAYVRFASVYKSFRDVDEFIAEMSSLVRSRPSE